MKRMSLNGWQRLWVVVSLLCLVPFALVTYRDWPRFEDARDYAGYHRALPPALRSHLVAGNATTLPEGAIEFRGDMPNGDSLAFRKGTTEEQAGAVARAYGEIVDTSVAKARWGLVIKAIVPWLGSSFTVYALGWSVAWIIRGFRQESPGA